jgi:hypothetical protein
MGYLTEFFMQRHRSRLHPKTVCGEKGDAALRGQPKIPQGKKD